MDGAVLVELGDAPHDPQITATSSTHAAPRKAIAALLERDTAGVMWLSSP
jgi:hypothetical protein